MINMKTVLVTNDNYLNVSVFDKTHPEVEPLDLTDETAFHYIESFYNSGITNVIDIDDETGIAIEYTNYNLELKDYMHMIENPKYKQLFMPILKNAFEYVTSHERKYSKKKKVKRENKYVNNKSKNKTGNKHIIKTIAASALTLTILMSIGKITSKIDTQTSKEALENTPDTHTITNIIEDEKIQEIAAPNIAASEIVNKVEEEIKHIKNVKSMSNHTDSEYAKLDYEDRSDSDKANTARAYYSDIIEKYSQTYGLDSNLILALATQESGVHDTTMNSGGATGLMQIQNDVWDGGTLTAYNFDTNSWEQIKVDIPSLSDLDYNVKVGCMIFQDCLRYNNYNILATIQAYNMGYGTTDRLISIYCNETGKTREEVLENQNDTGWLKYRQGITYGDQKYIEHVLSFYGPQGTISVQKTDGSICSVTVGNTLEKSMSL